MRTVPWLHHLHAEFCRYYWGFAEDFPGATKDERTELRKSALTAVGWVPADIFPARLRAAELVSNQVGTLTAGDEGADARDLRASVEHLLRLARNAVKDYGSNLASLYEAEPKADR